LPGSRWSIARQKVEEAENFIDRRVRTPMKNSSPAISDRIRS
jgi:hypothetical protein